VLAKSNGHAAHIDAPLDTKAAPPLRWSECQGDPPPRSWWIQDWLGPWPTLIAGAGGSGKTTLWQTIATALATGKPFLGPQVRPLNVLMWLCEDDKHEVWRRQHAINRYFGLEYVDLEQLSIVPRMGFDNTLLGTAYGSPLFTTLHEELKEQVEDLHTDVLVLDNIAQVFGGNENDRHQVTLFANGIGGLITERPFACVFMGHPARGQASEFSGSSAWENAMRMRWYLGPTLPDQKPKEEEDEQEPEVLYLAKRKANYSSKDWRKLRFQDGLLVPDEPQGISGRIGEAIRKEGAETVILSALSKLNGIGIQASDRKNSPDYLPAQIVAKRWHQDHTKRELSDALNRLMGEGKLVRGVVGHYSNRAKKYGVVFAQSDCTK
jgi:RecA-family ATPase